MDTDMGTNKRDDAELSGMVLAVSVATTRAKSRPRPTAARCALR